VVIEHTLDIRNQPAQIRAEAGCENDSVEFRGACIGEHDTVGREAIDTPRTLIEPSLIWRGADIDQRTRPSSSTIWRGPFAHA